MRTYRPVGVAAVFLAAFTVLTVLAIAITRALPKQNRFTPGQTATVVVLLALVLLLGLLIARSKVSAGPDGVVVVNGIRKHRLEWSQIADVSMRDGAPWPTLLTTDDRRVMCFAIQGSDKERAAEAVEWLRGQLQ